MISPMQTTNMRRAVLVPCLMSSFGIWPAPAAAQGFATGVVRPEEGVIVRSEVAGIIRSIEVQEGQEVSAGQILVQLGSDVQKIGVQLAEANLSRAEAAVVASRVTMENARKTLARVDIAATAIPEKDRQDIGDEVLRLQALLVAQEAELAEARVARELRQAELDRMRILAPFDGTVTILRAQIGDTVADLQTPILDLVNLDRLYVELVLPVEEIPNVDEGSRVDVQVETEVLGPAGHVEGIVSYINPTVDPSGRTFLVKIAISDPSRNIRPGMRAEVQLPER